MKPSKTDNLLSLDNEAYYNIFNNMQEIMAIFEIVRDDQKNPKDMVIKDVNKTYTLQLGILREEVINKSASLIYGHEFVDHYFKLVQTIPEIRKGKSFETYFPHLDRFYLTTIFPIGNDLYVTLGVDITKRKNLEIELEKEHKNLELKVQERTRELLESQRKLTEAQTIARLGNWELDLKTNKLWFSDEVYNIFGYNPDSKNVSDLQKLDVTYDILLNMIVHPDDREFLDKSFKEALKGDMPYNIDHRIILPNGEERIIHEQAKLVYDNNKIPLKMSGTIQDITEFKQLEESLWQSEEKFREIFDKANDMITLGEIKENGMPGNFIEVNEVGCKRLGYSKEEFRELTPSDIIAPDRRVEMANNAVELWTKGHAKFEIVHITKDGRNIPVEVNNHLFKMNGKTVALAISRDITEHKKSEKDLKELLNKLSQSNEKLELFADIASCDLQEPLETITGFAQLLKEQYKDTLDSNAGKFIDQILESSIRLKQMIHNLHEKSGFDAGIKESEPINLIK